VAQDRPLSRTRSVPRLESSRNTLGLRTVPTFSACLGGFSEAGIEESNALDAINVAHSSGGNVGPLFDSVTLIVVGCVTELSSDEQEQLALRAAEDAVVRGED